MKCPRLDCAWKSDENPHYPLPLRKHHPKASHTRVKGGRGAGTGQGELKKLRFDPLFALNHTCAMLRANMNRLFRRTWCTTKNKQGLLDHLSLYVSYHNQVLTQPIRSSRGQLVKNYPGPKASPQSKRPPAE